MMKRPTIMTRILPSIAVLLAACLSVPAIDAANDLRPEALQTSFGRAKDLKLITSVADIPEDGRRNLQTLFQYQQATSSSAMPLADIGMEWSYSDAKFPDLPWGQHRFTAVSDVLIAIVFVTGGSEVRYNVILAPRHSSDFCWFGIPSLHEGNLRLSVVQDFLRPDRDQTISHTPACKIIRAGIYD